LTEPPSAPDGTSRTQATHGLFQFTIEGRSAPGLFVAGWIALVIGGSGAFVGLLSGANVAGAVLFVAGLALVLPGLVLLGGSQAVERRHAGLAYAGPAPVIVFLAVLDSWYLATVLIATPLQAAGVVITGPILALLGVTIQAIVLLAILRLVVVGSEALSWREMGVLPLDRTALRDLGWGAIFAGPAIIATSLVLLALLSVIHQEPASPLPPTGTTAGLLLNLLAGAVIAPAYEELFFRGFTLTAWRRMTGPQVAIIRSAILFALIHASFQAGDTFGAAVGVAVVAVAARLPVALFLGWIFVRRGSLWASIGLHATFNAVLIVIAERALAG